MAKFRWILRVILGAVNFPIQRGEIFDLLPQQYSKWAKKLWALHFHSCPSSFGPSKCSSNSVSGEEMRMSCNANCNAARPETAFDRFPRLTVPPILVVSKVFLSWSKFGPSLKSTPDTVHPRNLQSFTFCFPIPEQKAVFRSSIFLIPYWNWVNCCPWCWWKMLGPWLVFCCQSFSFLWGNVLFGPNSFQISSNVNNALFSVEFKFATLSVHVSTSRKTISHHVLFVFKKKPRTCWANLSCSWSCKRSRSIPKTNFKFQWPPKFAQRFFLHASVGIFDDRHQQHAHFGMRSLRNIMVQTESLKIVDIKLLTLTRYHVGPLAWLRQSGQQVAVGPGSTVPGFSNFGESMQKHP